MFPYEEPAIIKGGAAFDDRGSLKFINDFGFEGVKRFYLIENNKVDFVRAWHGHQKEAKYFFPVSGSFICGAVRVDDWDNPSDNLDVSRHVLSADAPSILAIPPGYANGLMSLRPGSKLMVFSTTTLDESKGDDFRYSARKWDIWDIEER